MKPSRLISIFAGIIIILIIILLILIPSKQESEIKIGVIGPFTGPVSRFGEYMREGFDMAIDEINSKGGINNKKLKLIYEDDKCIDISGMVSALQKLKEIDKVVAVLGPYCGTTNVVAGQFSTDNDLFMIAPGDNLGKVGKYKVNTRYLLSKEAEVLADYALKQGWKKLSILHYDNDWGLGYKKAIESYLKDHGGELISAEKYDFSNLDVRTQFLKIKSADPDAVAIFDGTSGELFKQAFDLNLNKPLLSEWEIEKPETKGIAGPALEGVIYALPGGQITDFHRRFKEKYNKDPNIAHIDSYDAAMILAKALEACTNFDPQCMLDYVTNLKNYQGAGGSLTFNEEIWAFEKPFILKTVKNERFVELEEVE